MPDEKRCVQKLETRRLARLNSNQDKCHHPANSIIPVLYILNLHYIITMLKSFNIKKY